MVLGFETTSRWAEEQGAGLWLSEEWMDLFNRDRYEGRGAATIQMIGPSETREAFWPGPIEAAFPEARFLNDAVSFSTLADGVSQLEYIERAYGRGAIGKRLVVAASLRWLVGYAPGTRPLGPAIDKYSAWFRLDETQTPQALVPKTPLEALVARVRLAGHQSARFRRGLSTIAAHAKSRYLGVPLEPLLREKYLVHSRYHTREPHDQRQFQLRALAGEGLYDRTRTMNPAGRRADEIRGHFAKIREIAERNGSTLYVVTVPEASWLQVFFTPETAHGYGQMLQELAPPGHFLDLRGRVPDSEFFDWLHVTHEGGLRASRELAEFIKAIEDSA